jgi:hypothetical protein
MEINSLPLVSTPTANWAATARRSSPTTSSPSVTIQQTSLARSSVSSPSIGTASSLAETQNAASSVQLATIATTYSTTVAGRSYPASVEESGGVYTASVPNPPGASASGSSVESAENNLDIILDALV